MPELWPLLRQLVIVAVPLLLALTLHEAAHAYVADRLGDPTPRRAGRLTLNPLAHLDVVGTLVFVLTRMIGWAKPVPVTPSYFPRPRQGMLWVALAGPAANLALAGAFALGYHLIASSAGAGVRLGLPGDVWLLLISVARAGVIVNLGLALFNLMPIPPLDGSRILAGLLPGGAAAAVYRLQRYGMVLLLLVVFSGALDRTLYPALRLAARAFLGG